MWEVEQYQHTAPVLEPNSSLGVWSFWELPRVRAIINKLWQSAMNGSLSLDCVSQRERSDPEIRCEYLVLLESLEKTLPGAGGLQSS